MAKPSEFDPGIIDLREKESAIMRQQLQISEKGRALDEKRNLARKAENQRIQKADAAHKKALEEAQKLEESSSILAGKAATAAKHRADEEARQERRRAAGYVLSEAAQKRSDDHIANLKRQEEEYQQIAEKTAAEAEEARNKEERAAVVADSRRTKRNENDAKHTVAVKRILATEELSQINKSKTVNLAADLLDSTESTVGFAAQILGIDKELLDIRQSDLATDLEALENAENYAGILEAQKQILIEAGLEDEANLLTEEEAVQQIEERVRANQSLMSIEAEIMESAKQGNVTAMTDQDILNKMAMEGVDIAGMDEITKKQILDRVRGISEGTEKLADEDMANLLKAAGSMDDTLSKWKGKADLFGAALKNPAVALKLMQGTMLTMAVSFVKDLVGGAMDLRKELGLGVGEAVGMSTNIKLAELSTKAMLGDSTQIKAAAVAMVKEFGDTGVFTMAIAQDMALLVSTTGMAGDSAATLLKTMEGISDASIETNIQTLQTWGNLAKVHGVSSKLVLDDIASSTEEFAKFAKDGGDNIAFAAIRAAELGLQLKDVTKIADSLLNVEQSLQKEMEAEMLIGRDINLDKARELALSGDLEGLTNEITNGLMTQAEWGRLNVVQREAMADAIGVSVADMGKMIAGEKTSAQIAEDRAAAEQEAGDQQMAMMLAQMGVMALGAALQGASAVFGIYESFSKIPYGIGIPLAIAASAGLIATVAGIAGMFEEGVTDFGGMKPGEVGVAGEEGPELLTMGKGTNVVTNENTNAIVDAINTPMPSIAPTGGPLDMTELTNGLNKQHIQGEAMIKESRLLREQNEALMTKLIRTTAEQGLSG